MSRLVEVHFAILDFVFAVRGAPECVDYLAALLTPFACAHRTEIECAVVFAEHKLDGYRLEVADVCTWGNLGEVVQFCEWWLVSQALVRSEFCRLHGGAVTRGDGAVLLPGNSGCGKTTLTLGLVAHGFLPLADDVILLNRKTLEVSPFERCFHIDGGTQAVIDRLNLADRLLPRGSLPEGYCRPLTWGYPQRPCLVVLPQFRPGAPLDIEPLRPAQAWMTIVNQLIAPPAQAKEHFAVLRSLVDVARVYRLTYGDLDCAVPALDRLLARESLA